MLAPIRRFAEGMRKTVISVFWQMPRPLQQHAVADPLTSYHFEEAKLHAFSSLSVAEKLYLHNMSKAVACLKMILIHQNSLEAPMLFSIFYELLSTCDLPSLIEKAKASEFSDTDLKALIDYAVMFFTIGGNAFAGEAITPEFDKLKFSQLISHLPVVNKLGQSGVDEILDAMYSSATGDTRKPSMLSSTLCDDDCKQVREFLSKHSLLETCRVFKTSASSPPRFELLFMSGEENPVSLGDQEDQSEASPAEDAGVAAKKARLEATAQFVVKFGDYRQLLTKACSFLAAAKSYADESQAKMIGLLIEELMRASWVARDERLVQFVNEAAKEVEVLVDLSFGFPPARSCLDQRQLGAIVGIQNISFQSRLNAIMVKQKELTDVLKWDPQYLEKELNNGATQFVVLDVAQWAFNANVPLGMHVSEAPVSANTKNIIVNIISKSLAESQAMILKNKKAYMDYAEQVILLDVALHEFIGHAAGGRLFTQDEECDFKNMLTGEKVDASELYGNEESYQERFAEIDVQFEELRAEAIMLLLAAEGRAASVFGSEYRLLSVLMVHHSMSKGLLRYLSCPEAASGVLSWPDDHSRAFFALSSFLEAIPGLVVLDNENAEFDVVDSVIPAMLTALGDFVRQLQTFKATGDAESARFLLTTLTKPSASLQAWRRKVEETVEWPAPTATMYASTRLEDDGTPVQAGFPATAQGFFDSAVENYRGIYDQNMIYQQWCMDAQLLADSS